MAPDHRDVVLTVPPEPAVPVAATTFSNRYTLALLPVVPLPEDALATDAKPLVGEVSV